jgi:hypothetical protein
MPREIDNVALRCHASGVGKSTVDDHCARHARRLVRVLIDRFD